MARTNPAGKALITKLVTQNPDITLGEAQKAGKEAKVKFSPPSFYSWKREVLGGGGRRNGGGRGRGRAARLGSGNGMWSQVQAQLENAQRMEQALQQIAEILDRAVGRR
jgi:hypothetical protein